MDSTSDSALPPEAWDRLLEIGRQSEEAEQAESLGQYEILRELGRGGMGVVYEARDTELGRRVALKKIRAGALAGEHLVERFHREARLVARLSHPNIATLYEANEAFLAMQFVPGHTLAESEPADMRQLASWMRDAALALHHAHGEGIVHRDIKPQNLMVDPSEDRIYLMDFGLGKQSEVDSSLSQSGQLLGTPSYMAPEQARGHGESVDGRADLFSLGATFYEQFTGQRPFRADDVYELLQTIVHQDPPSARSLNPALDRDLETILHKCLEKAPSDRYATAWDLASDLTAWLDGRPIRARPPSTIYHLKKFVQRRKAPVIVGGLGAVGVVVVLAILLPLLSQSRDEKANADLALNLWSQLSNLMAESELYRRQGNLPFSDAKLQEAIGVCRNALEQHEFAEAYYFLGRLLRAQGDTEAARAALDQALELNAQLGEARYERGRLFVEVYGDKLSAHRLLYTANREDPWRRPYATDQIEQYMPFVSYIRAIAESDLETRVGQTSYFKAADGIYGRAELARIRGQDEHARKLLTELLDSEPLYAEAWLSLAILELSQGRWVEAIEACDRTTDAHRGLAMAFTLRALARYWQAKGTGDEIARLELALKDARHAIDGLRQRSGEAYMTRGNIELALGRTTQAISSFEAAVQADPLRAQCHANLALARIARMQDAPTQDESIHVRMELEQAIRELTEACAVDHRLHSAYMHRGRARMLLAEELATTAPPVGVSPLRLLAVQDFDNAIHSLPDYPEAYYRRGRLHARLGKSDRARHDLERALELTDEKWRYAPEVRSLLRNL